MYLIFNFVHFLWCFTDCGPRTYVRLVRWLLVALHFYVCRVRYTVHPCLFAEDGAFILASTLVPEEDLGTHSAWLSPGWRSAFVLGAWNRHVLKKWNMEKLRVCFASDYSEIFLRCLWNEWSLCWFCFEFSLSCTYNCWSIAECCRLAQCIWSLILCIFCDVLLTVVHVLMCVWCVGCWLPCIFTSVEFDILCILAFSQKMEHSSSPAPWCQKRIWALTVLGSVLLKYRHLCWAHETDMFWKSGTWRN